MRTKEKTTAATFRLQSTAFIAIGLLNLSYIVFGFILGWGFYFGLRVLALLGALFLAHGLLLRCNAPYRASFMAPAMKLFVAASLLFVLVMESIIAYGVFSRDTKNIDYVFVLGAGIFEDRPSGELRYRLDETIEYIQENPNVKGIVLCGGKAENRDFTEAYVMEQYMLSRGVDRNLLIKEERSTTTFENILFAREIIEEIDQIADRKIALASNYFHIFRARLIARRLGLEACGLAAETPLYIIPNHHIREYFAIIKSLLVDR